MELVHTWIWLVIMEVEDLHMVHVGSFQEFLKETSIA